MECTKRLKTLREDNDLSQKEIQAYSRYENGTNELPIHHLISLSKFYKVSCDYILGISDCKDIK